MFREHDGQRLVLANLGAGDFFGEIDFRGNASRYASARAMGEGYVISLERKKFLQKFLDDPSLAFHVLEKMSERIRKLCEELDRLSTGTRP